MLVANVGFFFRVIIFCFVRRHSIGAYHPHYYYPFVLGKDKHIFNNNIVFNKVFYLLLSNTIYCDL